MSREERGRRKFKYEPRSTEEWAKRTEQSRGSLRDSFLKDCKEFKPHPKDNRIRPLPPTWELLHGVKKHLHFGIDIRVHQQVGADNSQYLCNKAMTKIASEFGLPLPPDDWCPICDEQAESFKTDFDYAKTLYPKEKVLYALIDRLEEKDGVKVWAAPATKIDAAIALGVGRHQIDKLDDPDEGYDVEFQYTPPAKSTPGQYEAVEIARRDSPLGNDEWLDYVMEHPLTDFLKYYSSEYIKKVFQGKKSDEEKKEDKREPAPDKKEEKSDAGKVNDKLKDLTFEDIQDMRRRKLEDLAIDDLKFTEKEVDKFDEQGLKDEICKELRLKPSREKEEKSGGAPAGLDNLRDRYKRD